jgi:hypothetical protein
LQTNFDGFVFESGNLGTDDAFENRNDIMPNVGVGAFFIYKQLLCGFICPKFISNKTI